MVRVFTPPDQVAEAIRTLAAQPWSGPEQIAELKRLATDDHHLRLFFSEITDPAWLEPLHQAGVAHLPSHNAPWPVAALLAGLGKTSPEAVAALLKRLLVDTAAIAKPGRAAARFELLRIATQLGAPAHGVVVEVVKQHSDVPAVRSLSVDAALKADAADSAVLGVADAVLNHLPRPGGVGSELPSRLAGPDVGPAEPRQLITGRPRANRAWPVDRGNQSAAPEEPADAAMSGTPTTGRGSRLAAPARPDGVSRPPSRAGPLTTQPACAQTPVPARPVPDRRPGLRGWDARHGR